MSTYTIHEARITGAYPVTDILEFSMETAANAHGALTYAGLIPEADAARLVQQPADKQTVKVYLRDKLEFCGCPLHVSVDCQNGHCLLRVTLTTATSQMDAEPRNRFFQDTGRTFADILTEAYGDSESGSLVAIRGKNRIGVPILQYRETDWQFTLRMAGKLRTVVIPDVTSAEPQLSMGIPKRPAREEASGGAYAVSRNSAEFRRKEIWDDKTEYHHFLRYELQSGERYKLGDSVRVDGTALTVMRKTIAYERGMLVEWYLLGQEEEFAVPRHDNRRIAGLELEGTVEIRQGQELKLLLDIDAARPAGNKTWFSYAPATNNGMYSMPLEGEKVMLQWQSERDRDILAVRPVRRNGAGMPPPERHFLTEHENHLTMVAGKVDYRNPVGNMSWLADRGLDFSTGETVSVTAQQDINIRAQEQVRVYSPERITMCKAGVESSIDMVSNELHIKAKLKVTAKSKANKYKKTKLPEKTEAFEIDDSTRIKLESATSMRYN